MKKFRKILSVVLTLVMVLAMAAPGFAASGVQDNSGSITVNGTEGVTYSIYKMFNLESYNTNEDAYSYRVQLTETGEIDTDDPWYQFAEESEIKNNYLKVDAQGYVTWVGAKSDADYAEFAKLALEYATELIDTDADGEPDTPRIQVEAGNTKTADATGQVTFSNLPLGYYLVDSSSGALCALDTTDTSMTVTEKNDVPTIKKTVEGGEDVTDESGEAINTNSASVGDTLNFTITIDAKAGAEKYVVTDTMTSGLDLNISSITVYKDGTETDNIVRDDNYDLKTDITGNDTFTVTFTDEFCDSLTDTNMLYITYSAVLNENAITDGTNDVSENEVNLAYGHEHSVDSKTKTYTYKLGIIKTDDENSLLNGAEFELHASVKAEDGEGNPTYTAGDKIPVVGVTAGGLANSDTEAADILYYRPAKKNEVNNAVSIKAGNVRICGLGEGIYFLNETKAPEGYNKLSDMKQITVGDGDNLVDDLTVGKYTNGGVQFINKTGTLLPSTGGIGTTIFYAAGIVLMAGAVFFVVRRKRA